MTLPLAAVLLFQAPPLGSLVQPLPLSWETCKARAAEALKAEGFGGLLESGNGWIGSARGTSASLTCIGRNGGAVLVIVTAGGQLAREARRLYERIRVERGPDSAGAAPAPRGDIRSGWNATAESLSPEPGTRYNFWCPPGGESRPLWGGGVYSADSSVCTAAAHAGTITLEHGGNAIIEIRAGLASYPGSTRNGIVSRSGPRSDSSLAFRVVTAAPSP